MRVKTTTSHRHELKLTKSMLLKLLAPTVTSPASVSVRVPGGGDWSNTDIDIDNDDNVITICWKSEEEVVEDVALGA